MMIANVFNDKRRSPNVLNDNQSFNGVRSQLVWGRMAKPWSHRGRVFGWIFKNPRQTGRHPHKVVADYHAMSFFTVSWPNANKLSWLTPTQGCRQSFRWRVHWSLTTVHLFAPNFLDQARLQRCSVHSNNWCGRRDQRLLHLWQATFVSQKKQTNNDACAGEKLKPL